MHGRCTRAIVYSTYSTANPVDPADLLEWRVPLTPRDDGTSVGQLSVPALRTKGMAFADFRCSDSPTGLNFIPVAALQLAGIPPGSPMPTPREGQDASWCWSGTADAGVRIEFQRRAHQGSTDWTGLDTQGHRVPPERADYSSEWIWATVTLPTLAASDVLPWQQFPLGHQDRPYCLPEPTS